MSDSSKRLPLLQMIGFEKSFGKKHVHKGVDFEIYSREVVSLIGGSGSGKSVLLRAMIGLEHADRGQILYKGRDVTDLSEDQWNEVRANVAYAFQGGAMFDSLSVEENLIYPLDEHTKLSRKEKQIKVDAMLERFGLKGTNEIFPSQLSGGMLKRAGLARALMLDPEVILYDEPTAGLDPFNTKNIQDIINDLKNIGKGGVLVTHDMPTSFATSDRLCLLMDGKIVVNDKAESLRKGNDALVNSFVTGEIAYGTT